jgi:hypothetical protein
VIRAASNKQITRTLSVSDMTVGRDTATNVAPARKKGSKNSGYVPVTATNVAPSVSGAKAAAIVERKEKFEARRAELKREEPVFSGFPDANEGCRLRSRPAGCR